MLIKWLWTGPEAHAKVPPLVRKPQRLSAAGPLGPLTPLTPSRASKTRTHLNKFGWAPSWCSSLLMQSVVRACSWSWISNRTTDSHAFPSINFSAPPGKRRADVLLNNSWGDKRRRLCLSAKDKRGKAQRGQGVVENTSAAPVKTFNRLTFQRPLLLLERVGTDLRKKE